MTLHFILSLAVLYFIESLTLVRFIESLSLVRFIESLVLVRFIESLALVRFIESLTCSCCQVHSRAARAPMLQSNALTTFRGGRYLVIATPELRQLDDPLPLIYCCQFYFPLLHLSSTGVMGSATPPTTNYSITTHKQTQHTRTHAHLDAVSQDQRGGFSGRGCHDNPRTVHSLMCLSKCTSWIFLNNVHQSIITNR